MKKSIAKLIIAGIVALPCFSTNMALANTNSESKKCDQVGNVPELISDIHEFILKTHTISGEIFDSELNKLNNKVDELSSNINNCDPYADKLVKQMYGAIDTIRKEGKRA